MKVFIGGPRAISSLDDNVLKRLGNIINNSMTILVGDANGIDKSIQQYLSERNYKNVVVYASQGIARNNVGNWYVQNVSVTNKKKDFDYFAAKDIKMAESADCGFMIWNGKSKGTLNNLINLVKMNKRVTVYLTENKKFYSLKDIDNVKRLANACGGGTETMFTQLSGANAAAFIPQRIEQADMFDNK